MKHFVSYLVDLTFRVLVDVRVFFEGDQKWPFIYSCKENWQMCPQNKNQKKKINSEII